VRVREKKFLRPRYSPPTLSSAQALSLSHNNLAATPTTINTYDDPMEISSSPLPSSPPGLDELPELSPTLQRKAATIVISSDSDSGLEGEGDLTPDRTHNIPSNHKPLLSYSYDVQAAVRMNEYSTLDQSTTSPPTFTRPITVLLALSPQPATYKDQAAFEDFAARFAKDFSGECFSEKWSCVSVYGHYRQQAKWFKQGEERRRRERRDPDDAGAGRVSSASSAPKQPSEDDITTATHDVIGSIHPSALLAKLEQETDLHWRSFIPVMQALIERDVNQGMRMFVVGGLQMGDTAGIRAFAQNVSFPSFLPVRLHTRPDNADSMIILLLQIVEPAGILAFLPGDVSSVSNSPAVPEGFKSRAAMVSIIDSSHTKYRSNPTNFLSPWLLGRLRACTITGIRKSPRSHLREGLSGLLRQGNCDRPHGR
jgi:hypothetical protein